MRLKALLFLSLLTTPAFAAEGEYVFCDPQIDCVVGPCNFNKAEDLATGKLLFGIAIDTSALSPTEREQLETSGAFFTGSVVLQGRIETRGKDTVLVVTRIVRPSLETERKACVWR